MLKFATAFMTMNLLALSSFAQNAVVTKPDIYCSIYRKVGLLPWELLKTEALKRGDFKNAKLADLPHVQGSNLQCNVGTYTFSSGQTYEGVGCSYAGLGEGVASMFLTSTLSQAQQTGDEGKVQDYSGNEFLVQCNNEPPHQSQSFVSNLVYQEDHDALLKSVQLATGQSGLLALLKTQDGGVELRCKKSDSESHCTIQIHPKVWTTVKPMLVGVKGIDTRNWGGGAGVQFVTYEIKNSTDVSLLKKFLNGKSNWNSISRDFIDQFGGVKEEVPRAQVNCSAQTCTVSLNNYELKGK